MTQSGSNSQTRQGMQRVLIQVAWASEWPQSQQQQQSGQQGGSSSSSSSRRYARDYYARVTQRFCEAFDITPISESYTPVRNPNTGRYSIPTGGGAGAKSYKFWKRGANNERKAYSAVMASLPVYMVLKFAARLSDCIGITTPSGKTYAILRSSSGTGSGSSGTGSGSSGTGSGSSGTGSGSGS